MNEEEYDNRSNNPIDLEYRDLAKSIQNTQEDVLKNSRKYSSQSNDKIEEDVQETNELQYSRTMTVSNMTIKDASNVVEGSLRKREQILLSQEVPRIEVADEDSAKCKASELMSDEQPSKVRKSNQGGRSIFGRVVCNSFDIVDEEERRARLESEALRFQTQEIDVQQNEFVSRELFLNQTDSNSKIKIQNVDENENPMIEKEDADDIHIVPRSQEKSNSATKKEKESSQVSPLQSQTIKLSNSFQENSGKQQTLEHSDIWKAIDLQELSRTKHPLESEITLNKVEPSITNPLTLPNTLFHQKMSKAFQQRSKSSNNVSSENIDVLMESAKNEPIQTKSQKYRLNIVSKGLGSSKDLSPEVKEFKVCQRDSISNQNYDTSEIIRRTGVRNSQVVTFRLLKEDSPLIPNYSHRDDHSISSKSVADNVEIEHRRSTPMPWGGRSSNDFTPNTRKAFHEIQEVAAIEKSKLRKELEAAVLLRDQAVKENRDYFLKVTAMQQNLEDANRTITKLQEFQSNSRKLSVCLLKCLFFLKGSMHKMLKGLEKKEPFDLGKIDMDVDFVMKPEIRNFLGKEAKRLYEKNINLKIDQAVYDSLRNGVKRKQKGDVSENSVSILDMKSIEDNLILPIEEPSDRRISFAARYKQNNKPLAVNKVRDGSTPGFKRSASQELDMIRPLVGRPGDKEVGISAFQTHGTSEKVKIPMALRESKSFDIRQRMCLNPLDFDEVEPNDCKVDFHDIKVNVESLNNDLTTTKRNVNGTSSLYIPRLPIYRQDVVDREQEMESSPQKSRRNNAIDNSNTQNDYVSKEKVLRESSDLSIDNQHCAFKSLNDSIENLNFEKEISLNHKLSNEKSAKQNFEVDPLLHKNTTRNSIERLNIKMIGSNRSDKDSSNDISDQENRVVNRIPSNKRTSPKFQTITQTLHFAFGKTIPRRKLSISEELRYAFAPVKEDQVGTPRLKSEKALICSDFQSNNADINNCQLKIHLNINREEDSNSASTNKKRDRIFDASIVQHDLLSSGTESYHHKSAPKIGHVNISFAGNLPSKLELLSNDNHNVDSISSDNKYSKLVEKQIEKSHFAEQKRFSNDFTRDLKEAISLGEEAEHLFTGFNQNTSTSNPKSLTFTLTQVKSLLRDSKKYSTTLNDIKGNLQSEFKRIIEFIRLELNQENLDKDLELELKGVVDRLNQVLKSLIHDSSSMNNAQIFMFVVKELLKTIEKELKIPHLSEQNSVKELEITEFDFKLINRVQKDIYSDRSMKAKSAPKKRLRSLLNEDLENLAQNDQIRSLRKLMMEMDSVTSILLAKDGKQFSFIQKFKQVQENYFNLCEVLEEDPQESVDHLRCSEMMFEPKSSPNQTEQISTVFDILTDPSARGEMNLLRKIYESEQVSPLILDSADNKKGENRSNIYINSPLLSKNGGFMSVYVESTEQKNFKEMYAIVFKIYVEVFNFFTTVLDLVKQRDFEKYKKLKQNMRKYYTLILLENRQFNNSFVSRSRKSSIDIYEFKDQIRVDHEHWTQLFSILKSFPY